MLPILRLFLILACFSIPAWAQPTADPPISTDRPSQSNSPGLVPKGFVQFELGWQLSQDEQGEDRILTYGVPSTLLRFRLDERVEFRLSWDGYLRQEINALDDKINGPSDGGFEAKLSLWKGRGFLPEAALGLGMNLPFGREVFTTGRVDPFIMLLLSHSLHERVSLTYNLGPSWNSNLDDGGDRDTLSSVNYIITTDFAATDNSGVFWEYFGSASSSGPVNSFDSGFSYTFGNKIILDAFFGKGFSDDSTDWFVGSGVTFRLHPSH